MDTLNIKVNALASNESFLRSTIGAYCARQNPALDVISDIKTAVSEAVTNAIVHGYANNADGIIEVSAEINNNVLDLRISDFGVGIDDVKQAMSDFFTTKGDEERSGLGFTIMKSFMDSLEVKSYPNEGTTVIMTKKL